MINPNVLFLLLFCGLFVACNPEKDVLIEEDPQSNIINIDGHDFVIEGDIDGEAFVLRHESNVQFNAPRNDDMASSARPFFGTSFRLQYPGELPEAEIFLGITENGDSNFGDVIQVGTYGWYGFDVPSQSVGEAFINTLTFGEDVAMTSATWPHNSDPDNYLEITSVTPLELDENLDETYAGRLYKVEGHFAVDLDKWDNSGDTPRLTIDYFSAIFYDNSL